MFKRLKDLVGRPGLWEDTTVRILELIDSMNLTFEEYDQYFCRVHQENEVLANVMTCEDFKGDANNDKQGKKTNFLSRLGHRISRAFTKSKSPNLVSKNDEERISKSCLDDLPVTSKSHDNLKTSEESYKVKRKKFGNFLNIPQKTDRCLSEGDLTREEDKFFSDDSSPNARMGRKHDDSSENDTLIKDSHNSDSVLKDRKNFKNELALRLRSKNPPKPKKDDESDSSKTPDSPPGNGTGTSPSRQVFNGSRTPYSMSSLSHSSNSLISSNVANYGTSDGESMSRSVIDSTDDIGIVVDLATPISKTTTASLLDSTAARQKIAASRPRRVRPKANDHIKSISGEKLKDSGKFSPAREKREILEEISEEDSQPPSNSPVSMESDSILNSCLVIETTVDNVVKMETAESPKISCNLEKDPSNSNDHVPLRDTPEHDSSNFVSHNHPISDPSSNIERKPNESGDSTDASVSIDNSSIGKETTDLKTPDNITTDSVSVTSKFATNKLKFAENVKPLIFNVNLRPINSKDHVGLDASSKDNEKGANKSASLTPSNIHDNSNKDILHHDDPKIKVNRYVPMNTNRTIKSEIPSETTSTADVIRHSQNTYLDENVTANKRKSRIYDLIKNIENNAHSADSH